MRKSMGNLRPSMVTYTYYPCNLGGRERIIVIHTRLGKKVSKTCSQKTSHAYNHRYVEAKGRRITVQSCSRQKRRIINEK
jgi:hypothetical protein